MNEVRGRVNEVVAPLSGLRRAQAANARAYQLPSHWTWMPARVLMGRGWAGRACCFFKYFFDKYLR